MEISTETPPNVANVWSDARPEIERGRDRVRHEFRCEVLQVNHPPSLVRRRHSGAGGRGRRTDNQRGRRSRRRLPHQRSRLCPPLQHSRPSIAHSSPLFPPLRAVDRRDTAATTLHEYESRQDSPNNRKRRGRERPESRHRANFIR